MMQKLSDWGINKNTADDIIVDLITNNFLNEERFAVAFATGKFNTKRWGKRKIEYELKRHQISSANINTALSSIDENTYLCTLKKLLTQRAQTVKANNPFEREQKLLNYAVQKGFEHTLIIETIKNIEQ